MIIGYVARRSKARMKSIIMKLIIKQLTSNQMWEEQLTKRFYTFLIENIVGFREDIENA